MSSSGHLALVPHLLGWSYADLPAHLRKSFEVALHAGSAPVLAFAARDLAGARVTLLCLTLAPPALAGLAFERAIEERLGGVRAVALAQLLAGAGLLLCDRCPERRSQPDALDHLAVGFAQAAALAPGVSRSGAALTAGRLRGLSRPAALRLALRAALPVTLGAGALKGARMLSDPPPRPMRAPIAAGLCAALLSTACSLPLLGLLERPRILRAVACYRIALGAAALAVRRGG